MLVAEQPSAVMLNAGEPVSATVSAALADPPLFVSVNVVLVDVPRAIGPTVAEGGVKAIDGVWAACPADANSAIPTRATTPDAVRGRVSVRIVAPHDRRSRWVIGGSLPLGVDPPDGGNVSPSVRSRTANLLLRRPAAHDAEDRRGWAAAG